MLISIRMFEFALRNKVASQLYGNNGLNKLSSLCSIQILGDKMYNSRCARPLEGLPDERYVSNLKALCEFELSKYLSSILWCSKMNEQSLRIIQSVRSQAYFFSI